MIRTLHFIVFLGIAVMAGAQDLPSKREILADLQKVNRYYMNKFPETETVSTGEPNWLEASYFNGHLALFDLFPTKENINYALQWGKHNAWSIGNRPHEADNQCVGQAYMDMYYAFGAKDDFMISKVGSSVRNLVNRSAVNEWDWIDALYMAMPVLTRYGIHHEDSRYFDKLYAMYSSTKVSQKLYDVSKGFWYRDGKVLSGKKKTCYWSRGNGWVFGGHVRTLKYLPEDDSNRQEYIDTFKEMAEALKGVQRSDGFWNASLADPSYYPGPETSGTAFFVYGMAWGINNGILDRDTYLPTVIKGWNGLVSKALTESGRIGYTQGVADEPKDAQPVTINSSRHYGEGNFLLAGTEVIKLAEGEIPVPTDFFVKKVEMLSASKLKVSFYEPAEKTSAEAVANYHVNKDVNVVSANLLPDGMSCELTLSNISKGGHGISFVNIKSVSDKTIAAGSGKYFMHNQDVASSIDQHLKKQPQIQVYPNPVSQDYVNLEFTAAMNGQVNVQLLDYSGKVLLSKNYAMQNNGLHQKLFLEDVSQGIYILKISGEGFNLNRKLVLY